MHGPGSVAPPPMVMVIHKMVPGMVFGMVFSPPVVLGMVMVRGSWPLLFLVWFFPPPPVDLRMVPAPVDVCMVLGSWPLWS